MQLHDLLIEVDEYIERLCVPREEALGQALRNAEEPQ
jgi:metal-responsive CopG/Arc/MetJ family transcriptional regulator